MRNKTLERVKEALRHDGTMGYPVVYLMSDGETLCEKCVRSEWRSIVYATKNHLNDGWKIEAPDVFWEGAPMFCAHCNIRLESAYGDPEAME